MPDHRIIRKCKLVKSAKQIGVNWLRLYFQTGSSSCLLLADEISCIRRSINTLWEDISWFFHILSSNMFITCYTGNPMKHKTRTVTKQGNQIKNWHILCNDTVKKGLNNGIVWFWQQLWDMGLRSNGCIADIKIWTLWHICEITTHYATAATLLRYICATS